MTDRSASGRRLRRAVAFDNDALRATLQRTPSRSFPAQPTATTNPSRRDMATSRRKRFPNRRTLFRSSARTRKDAAMPSSEGLSPRPRLSLYGRPARQTVARFLAPRRLGYANAAHDAVGAPAFAASARSNRRP